LWEVVIRIRCTAGPTEPDSLARLPTGDAAATVVTSSPATAAAFAVARRDSPRRAIVEHGEQPTRHL
jgi:hypothetical protein